MVVLRGLPYPPAARRVTEPAPPDEAARAAAPGHIPEIDGLRAIAVLAVFAYHLHAPLLPGGFAGVDVFFVVSGYVVTLAAARYGADRTILSFAREFYRRRVARIVPPLLAMLAVTAVLAVAVIPSAWLSRTEAETALSAVFGLSNFVLLLRDDGYFAPAAEFNSFTHTWSLAVEEQFYFLFPALFLLWWRGGRGGWRAAILPGLCAVSFAWALWASREAASTAYYMMPARFWELGLGMMLAQWRLRGAPLPARLSGALRLGVPAGLALLAIGLWTAGGMAFPAPGALPAVLGTGLILAGLSAAEGRDLPGTRALRQRHVRYVGLISYALYLWHWPVIVLIRWTIGLEGALGTGLAVTLPFVLAGASTRWLEGPLRRWMGTPLRAFGAGGVLVAATAALVAGVYLNRSALTLSATGDRAAWYVDAPMGQPAGPGPFEERRLWIVGDSHAQAYRDMVAGSAEELGFAYRVRHTRCGLGAVVRAVSGDPGCAAETEALLADIETRARPGDILFLASLRLPRLANQHGRPDRAARAVTVSPEGLAQTRALIERMAAGGLRVLIDLPKPVFPSPPFRCADWFNRTNPACAPGTAIARAEIEPLRRPVVAAARDLAAAYPDQVLLWDPLPALCGDVACAAFDAAGRPLFFDGDHLSGHGNAVLVDSFSAVLREAWGPSS